MHSRKTPDLSAWTLTVLLSTIPSAALADDGNCVPKELYLVHDGTRLMAGNILFNRFDELTLSDKETLVRVKEGQAVAIVVTSERVAGYGARTPLWQALDLDRGEVIERVVAQDYGGLVVSNLRLLNFNGNNGAWAEVDR